MQDEWLWTMLNRKHGFNFRTVHCWLSEQSKITTIPLSTAFIWSLHKRKSSAMMNKSPWPVRHARYRRAVSKALVYRDRAGQEDRTDHPGIGDEPEIIWDITQQQIPRGNLIRFLTRRFFMRLQAVYFFIRPAGRAEPFLQLDKIVKKPFTLCSCSCTNRACILTKIRHRCCYLAMFHNFSPAIVYIKRTSSQVII